MSTHYRFSGTRVSCRGTIRLEKIMGQTRQPWELSPPMNGKPTGHSNYDSFLSLRDFSTNGPHTRAQLSNQDTQTISVLF
jgi:hypothetical protein